MESILENRPVVLITGCSSGFGYETALLMARKGWRVFATMRNLRKAAPLKAAAAGLSLEVLQLDVDRESSVKRAVAQALRKAGRIDVLVNNAGFGAYGAILDFEDVEIRAQYETNVLGVLRTARAVLPSMIARGRGRIINVGSLAGKVTFTGMGLYCSSKYAVEAVTEAIRLEGAALGIEACVVEPGMFHTSFGANRRWARRWVAKGSPFQVLVDRMVAFMSDQKRNGGGASPVARVVLKAATAGRMSIRYPVGWDSWTLSFLMKVLPGAWFEALKRLALPK
jgi:NAD(P)-dependent dehydrogenase (short-subunit alcohol dehydrogenase family)